MNTVLFRWPLAFVIRATFCIPTVVRLEGQSPCWKADVYDRAPGPRDATPAGGCHPSVGSLPPGTALENGNLNTSLVNALEKDGISVPGGNLKTACTGFKELGQCIAAMHAAKNLNLSFEALQGKVTGSNSVKLDKAIEGLGRHDRQRQERSQKSQETKQ